MKIFYYTDFAIMQSPVPNDAHSDDACSDDAHSDVMSYRLHPRRFHPDFHVLFPGSVPHFVDVR